MAKKPKKEKKGKRQKKERKKKQRRFLYDRAMTTLAGFSVLYALICVAALAFVLFYAVTHATH